MIKLSRKDILWSAHNRYTVIGYIFNIAVEMGYSYFEFNSMLWKIDPDKSGYGDICPIQEVEFVEDEKVEEEEIVTIGDRVVLLDDFFACRKIETHELLTTENFVVIDGFEDRNSVVIHYYSTISPPRPIYSKLIDGYKYKEIRKEPKGEIMKVTRIQIECYCGSLLTITLEEGIHTKCHHCNRLWKVIRMPEIYGFAAEENKIEEAKNEIREFLQSEEWNHEKIEKFLYINEKLIKGLVEHIIKYPFGEKVLNIKEAKWK